MGGKQNMADEESVLLEEVYVYNLIHQQDRLKPFSFWTFLKDKKNN